MSLTIISFPFFFLVFSFTLLFFVSSLTYFTLLQWYGLRWLGHAHSISSRGIPKDPFYGNWPVEQDHEDNLIFVSEKRYGIAWPWDGRRSQMIAHPADKYCERGWSERKKNRNSTPYKSALDERKKTWSVGREPLQMHSLYAWLPRPCPLWASTVTTDAVPPGFFRARVHGVSELT